MDELRTRLVSDGDDPGTGLPGWRVEATWTTAASDGLPSVPARRAATSDSDGFLALEIPSADEIAGALTIVAATPDGIRVAERSDAPQEVWKLRAPAPGTARHSDPAVAKRVRFTGRVVDAAGKPIASGTPLVIFGRGGNGAPPITLVQAVVGSGGYFHAARSEVVVVRAWARVGGVDASAVPLDDTGRLEPRIVVVAARHPSAKADCDCDPQVPRSPELDDLSSFPQGFSADLGGRCHDMTFPNRVLEEVAYFKVVRVTEPDVEGISTTPPRVDPKVGVRIEGLIAGATVLRDARAPAPMLHADIATRLFSHPERLSPATLADAVRDSRVAEIDAGVRAVAQGSAGRVPMDAAHAVDWDDNPTVFQAVSVAHGHLLQYRQVWRADGYSLGDLLYSLPLAPGQKKLVSVLDWSRTEESAREEWTTEEEELHAFLERDRDVVEIVDSHLRETSAGGSRAHTWGGGGGIGIGAIGTGFGVFAGVAGGGGGSSSTSWQDSGRDYAADAMQSIRDGTIQGASAVRSTRSTVVQTDHQAERAQATTEVVVNYNHCHALTIEYFEILRHFTVTHELAHVQECLFVPLPMRWFDRAKALRWRETLLRFLRDPTLRDAFAAAERIEANWVGYDTPVRSYAEEAPESLEGELWLSFVIPRPRDDEDGKFQVDHWRWLAPLLPQAPLELWTSKLNQRRADERDLVFRQEVAPRVASDLTRRLRCSYVTNDGSVTDVPLDPTLVGRYSEGTQLYVTLRPAGALPNVPREEIQRFRVRLDGIQFPEDARVLVHRGKLRYETAHLRHLLFDEPRILDDLAVGDEVLVPTPLAREEMRNPRQEDRELCDRLIKHLNDHLEYYHQLIWMAMDPGRRYMLLDGFAAPNANGRSLASVVENRLLGIVGNCMVLPVSPGNVLAPPLHDADGGVVPLVEHYAVPPEAPIRVTLPTRGVFAEAMQGSCNSCESIDDTRLWRFDESPIPDSPVPPEPVSLESRAEAPADATPTPAPPPIINIQAAPALPDPTGLGPVFALLAKSNLFKDVTGLAANQEAALGAYQAALDTAKSFGGRASAAVLQQDLANNIDRKLEQIAAARSSGLLTNEQASKVAFDALKNLVGEAPPTGDHPIDDPAVQDAVGRAADAQSGSVKVESPGERVDVTFSGGEGDVTLGNSPVASVLPDFERWVDMPVWIDNRALMFGTDFDLLGSPVPVPDVPNFEANFWPALDSAAIDESWRRAEDLKFVRRKPTDRAVVQVHVRYQVTIPGKSATAKTPIGKGKVPLVVFIHGNHQAFHPLSLRMPPSYKGYTRIQESLARLGIASISIDDNISNWLNQFVEMRARMVLEAITDLQRRAKKRKDPLENRIDFDRVILVGHSRGGEGVTRAAAINKLETPDPEKVVVKGVCTIAPTDMKGDPLAAIATVLDQGNAGFFLGIWGSHDGDVDGAGGGVTGGGSSFRHYARAQCPKAHVYIDLASHNRFNSVWVDPDFAGADEGEILDSDITSLHDRDEHADLISDYLGALARWRLLGDRTGAEVLDGRTANSVGAPVSMLHQFSGTIPVRLFGPPVQLPVEPAVIDSFEDATPGTNDAGVARSIASTEGVAVVKTDTMPTPPATVSIGSFANPQLITHVTGALFVPLRLGITNAVPRIRTDPGAAPVDLSAHTALEFDIALLGSLADATELAKVKPPRISVALTDEGAASGMTVVVGDSQIYAHRTPRPPIFRQVERPDGSGGTVAETLVLFRFETVRVPLAAFTGIDPAKLRRIEIHGDDSLDSEFLIDNIRFVKEV